MGLAQRGFGRQRGSRSRREAWQRGVGAIEMLGVIGAMALLLVTTAPFVKSYLDNRQHAITADQMKLALQGANKFVQNNAAPISAAAAPTVTYSWAQIAASMPNGLSPTNPYGQTYQLAIQQIGVWPNNQLIPLVQTVGGQAIPDGELRAIAKLMGGSGGYISTQNPSNAEGALGAWSVPLANVGANPGTGRLAGALFFQSAAQSNPYLYRAAVPGSPELNQMSTAIDMTGNNINSAGTVSAQKVTLPSGNSLQIGNGFFYGDGANVALRSQPGGAAYIQDVNGNPADAFARSVNASVNVNATNNITAGQEIYAGSWLRTLGDGGVYFQKYGGGLYMSDSTWIRAYAGRSIWTPQTLQADAQVSTGSLYSWGRARTGEWLQIDGVASEGVGCWPSGLVAQDGNGRLLACQGGVWQAPGSVPSGTMCGNSQDGRYDWTGPGLCQGNDPWYSCPSGFHQHVVASIKGETVMTCQKD